ncbi:ankyrin repeats (3 copies) domain-containing protein [Ditylenchus destructor]|uniref:Ankyrin repeats (3 copies) domain-containing protein n=1 Tax=Ditylenchus destructor TaxID=166010 RepID=A0AAD4R6G5_9BILA|nr:ankyrin repeats (3 copies) domain-containing protein [Ditylenchus destructor]
MGLLTSRCRKGRGANRSRDITRTISSFDPDEKWSNLYREREKNNLYKWVGVRTGGELITVYEKDGEEGVLQFAQEKFEPMMYNEGKLPQLIKFADYVRWKKSVNTVFGVTEQEENFNEANSKFREHEAQWRLNKRGVEGETLVHLLLNREEPLCSEIARILVHKYPGLSKDIYLGDEMFGQSSLHLAIVHDDYDTVQLLLEKGAAVNSRASGDFFLPDEDEESKDMEYKGYAYYGEYPLAFAACFENKDIYDLLIQYGADPDLQDRYGNTCLHMCVINYSNSMYSYAVRHWHKPAKTNIVNNAGYTPLTLATKLGRKQIFEEMLELMKVEFWRFSDMTCSAYPLDTLDTIRPDGSTNYDSALMTVINGSTQEHLEMIGSEVIQRLLADKWKAYAWRKLFERLALLIVHLFCLCVVVYTRPTDIERLYLDKPQFADYVRTVFEVFTIISCCWFVFIQQLDELRTQGFYGYARNLKTAPAKVVFLLANLCLLSCVPFRFLRHTQIEESLLVFALPGSWIFLLFFARSLKLTGPFVQMIYSMIAGDMIRFAIISAIFLVSFSQVFYFVGKDIMEGYSVNTYSSYLETFISLFRASMGGYDYEEFSCTNYEPLTKTLFVFYMFIMPIMMINILIAMMGNTYTTVITQAEKAWRQQYAQIVMVLERSMNRQKLAACQLEYSIKLNDPGRETRGLMVIKQTKKTKAKQRKQAINNWKHIGRKVNVMVKELGAEHAKFLLHSHDRIITDNETAATVMTNQTGLGSTGNIASRSQRSMSNVTPGVTAEGATIIGGLQHGMDEDSEATQQEPASTIQYLQHHQHQNHSGVVLDTTSLSAVVTHTNNLIQNKNEGRHAYGRLYQAVAYHRRLFSPHRGPAQAQPAFGVTTLANGHIAPGQRTVAMSRSQSGAMSANGNYTGETAYSTPPLPHHNYVHTTQRTLAPVLGSKVRGVEMLPSVDIPNIPSSHTAVTIAQQAQTPSQADMTPPIAAAPDTISFSSRPNTMSQTVGEPSGSSVQARPRSPPTARISRRITMHNVPLPSVDNPTPMHPGRRDSPSGGKSSSTSTTTTNQSWPSQGSREHQRKRSKSKPQARR